MRVNMLEAEAAGENWELDDAGKINLVRNIATNGVESELADIAAWEKGFSSFGAAMKEFGVYENGNVIYGQNLVRTGFGTLDDPHLDLAMERRAGEDESVTRFAGGGALTGISYAALAELGLVAASGAIPAIAAATAGAAAAGVSMLARDKFETRRRNSLYEGEDPNEQRREKPWEESTWEDSTPTKAAKFFGRLINNRKRRNSGEPEVVHDAHWEHSIAAKSAGEMVAFLQWAQKEAKEAVRQAEIHADHHSEEIKRTLVPLDEAARTARLESNPHQVLAAEAEAIMLRAFQAIMRALRTGYPTADKGRNHMFRNLLRYTETVEVAKEDGRLAGMIDAGIGNTAQKIADLLTKQALEGGVWMDGDQLSAKPGEGSLVCMVDGIWRKQISLDPNNKPHFGVQVVFDANQLQHGNPAAKDLLQFIYNLPAEFDLESEIPAGMSEKEFLLKATRGGLFLTDALLDYATNAGGSIKLYDASAAPSPVLAIAERTGGSVIAAAGIEPNGGNALAKLFVAGGASLSQETKRQQAASRRLAGSIIGDSATAKQIDMPPKRKLGHGTHSHRHVDDRPAAVGKFSGTLFPEPQPETAAVKKSDVPPRVFNEAYVQGLEAKLEADKDRYRISSLAQAGITDPQRVEYALAVMKIRDAHDPDGPDLDDAAIADELRNMGIVNNTEIANALKDSGKIDEAEVSRRTKEAQDNVKQKRARLNNLVNGFAQTYLGRKKPPKKKPGDPVIPETPEATAQRLKEDALATSLIDAISRYHHTNVDKVIEEIKNRVEKTSEVLPEGLRIQDQLDSNKAWAYQDFAESYLPSMMELVEADSEQDADEKKRMKKENEATNPYYNVEIQRNIAYHKLGSEVSAKIRLDPDGMLELLKDRPTLQKFYLETIEPYGGPSEDPQYYLDLTSFGKIIRNAFRADAQAKAEADKEKAEAQASETDTAELDEDDDGNESTPPKDGKGPKPKPRNERTPKPGNDPVPSVAPTQATPPAPAMPSKVPSRVNKGRVEIERPPEYATFERQFITDSPSTDALNVPEMTTEWSTQGPADVWAVRTNIANVGTLADALANQLAKVRRGPNADIPQSIVILAPPSGYDAMTGKITPGDLIKSITDLLGTLWGPNDKLAVIRTGESDEPNNLSQWQKHIQQRVADANDHGKSLNYKKYVL